MLQACVCSCVLFPPQSPLRPLFTDAPPPLQECLEAVTDAADGGADSGGSDSDDAASVAGSDDDGSGWQSSGWGSEATGGERLRSGGSSISSHRGSSFEGSGWEWMGAGCGYASSGSSGSGSSGSSEPDGSDRRGAWWGALCLFLSSESDSGSDRQPAAAAGGRAAVVGRKSRWARENSDPGLYKQLSSCGLDLGPALLDWSLERFLAEVGGSSACRQCNHHLGCQRASVASSARLSTGSCPCHGLSAALPPPGTASLVARQRQRQLVQRNAVQPCSDLTRCFQLGVASPYSTVPGAGTHLSAGMSGTAARSRKMQSIVEIKAAARHAHEGGAASGSNRRYNALTVHCGVKCIVALSRA